MYILEEYLAAIFLTILLGLAMMVIMALLVTLREEDHFLDRAISAGRLALPPSWLNLRLVVAIVERWRVAIGTRARLWWRRACPRSWPSTLKKATAALDQANKPKGDQKGVRQGPIHESSEGLRSRRGDKNGDRSTG